jgi:hypothetical protein
MGVKQPANFIKFKFCTNNLQNFHKVYTEFSHKFKRSLKHMRQKLRFKFLTKGNLTRTKRGLEPFGAKEPHSGNIGATRAKRRLEPIGCRGNSLAQQGDSSQKKLTHARGSPGQREFTARTQAGDPGEVAGAGYRNVPASGRVTPRPLRWRNPAHPSIGLPQPGVAPERTVAYPGRARRRGAPPWSCSKSVAGAHKINLSCYYLGFSLGFWRVSGSVRGTGPTRLLDACGGT